MVAVDTSNPLRVTVNPWCEPDDLPDGRLSGISDVDRAFAIGCATELLFVLSGRQFRSGNAVIRPVSIQGAYSYQSFLYPYSSMSGYGDAWGFAAGWSWSAIGMGWWQNGQDTAECVLQGPVQRINDVIVDGASLGGWPPPNPNFTLYDRRRLVRNVGPGTTGGGWPWNQQLQLPPSSPGTWQIDYDWGKPPPQAGKAACIVLSVDIARSLSGSDPSQIPERVLSMASQGITVSVGDPLNSILEELTGLPLVDLFLQAYNPARLRRRSIFVAPNTIQGRDATPS